MPPHPQRRILAVDDSEAGLYVTSRTLRAAGFAVIEATSGAEALRLASEQPDIILLDVNLPDIGGFEVCRLLKADPQTKTIPVLHHSATHVQVDSLVAGLEGGADGYLTQPVEARELIATIRAFIRIKDAEDSLRKNLQRFQLAARATFNVIRDWDPATNTVWWNDSFSTLFGYGPEEVALNLEGWKARVHPEDRERVSTKLEAALASERESWSDEYRFLCRDGSYKFVEDRGQIVRDADHRVVRMLGAMQDVTARKRAEQVLMENEANLQLSFEVGRLGDWRWEIPTGEVVWSQRCKALYGLPPDTVMSYERFLQAVHPDDRANTAAALQRAVETRGSYVIEKRVVWPDGSLHWTATRGQVFCDAAGQPVRLLGVTIDTTERKRAEESLRDSLREKEVLLKEVHHRVKNNLQVITSLLRLEANRSGHAGTQTTLLSMQDRIRSMALLHETIYRSEMLSAVNLAIYLTKLSTQLFRSVVRQPGAIQLRLNLASVSVEADQAIPCGLLVNELLTNALKHGFPGGRTGEVRVELELLADGAQLRLRVADTGIGLPGDFAGKHGKSLGLQLVSDLTRQLQGALAIAPGPGAEFSVTFPLRGGVEPAVAATASPASS